MRFHVLIQCLLFLLVVVMPLCASAADYTVEHVINGKSFTLTSGQTVRLASIQVPNVQEANTSERRGRPGEPLGEEARDALVKIIGDQAVTLRDTPAKPDRHNRLLGQAYAGTTWLQGEMLKQGFAMVYSFIDTKPETTQSMLALEQDARAAKRGIWAHPYFRVVSPEETSEFINRFKLVEGRVVSVNQSRGNTYINFFDQWKGKFALFVSRKNAKAFEGYDFAALKGKSVRVRGWIHYHNAPMISLTHPGEMEIR